MSYREDCNKAKDIRRGVVDVKAPTASRKKPKTDRPYKVVRDLFGHKDYVWHHCETQELAEKMIRKHTYPELFRIEYRPTVRRTEVRDV